MKWPFTFVIFLIVSLFPFMAFSQPTLQIFDKTKVCDGYILWQDIETGGHLIDRKGKVLFNFPGSFNTFFMNKKAMVSCINNNLTVYNKHFDELWKVQMKESIHHEITVTPEDNILLISYEKKIVKQQNIRFDIILCFDSLGNELYKWSTYEQRDNLLCFLMKEPDIFLYKGIKNLSDPEKVFLNIAPGFSKAGNIYPEFFHMNTIQIIPENKSEIKDPAFRKGNILLSFCNYNDSLASFLAIVDPLNYKILWHYVQKDHRQMHTPSMLPNGNILVYVNSIKTGSSFIDEINPLNKQIEWEYVEKFPNISKRVERGSCQRLPNGNTLISNANGYVYELTPQKEIVWQLFTDNPYPVYRASFYSKDELNWLINED